MDGPLLSTEHRKRWIQNQVRQTDEYLSEGQAQKIEADVRNTIGYEKVHRISPVNEKVADFP